MDFAKMGGYQPYCGRESLHMNIGVQRGVYWGSIPLLFSRQCYKRNVTISIYDHGIDILQRAGMGIKYIDEKGIDLANIVMQTVEKSTVFFIFKRYRRNDEKGGKESQTNIFWQRER